MRSFSSNAIFHACNNNLKLRRNLPAETIQIGVTEVPGTVRQTCFPSGTINLSTFHNMRFNTSQFSAKWSDSSGNRISNLSTTKIFILCFELARIFSACDSRSKMQTKKLYVQPYKNWDRFRKKQNSLRQTPPLSLEIPEPLNPPPNPLEFSIPFMGVWIFSGTMQ